MGYSAIPVTKRKKRSSISTLPQPNYSLILIPNAPIRKEARHRYKKLLNSIQSVQEQIHRFTEEDEPAYERWLKTEFGPLLQELQNAKNQAAAKQNLIVEVDLVALRFGLTHHQAYQRVQIQREKLGVNPKAAPEPETEEDEINDTFERMFGFRPGILKKQAPKKAHSVDSFKSLYRQLVRRLHPDIRKIHTSQMDSLWFDAQQAYLGENHSELEKISLLCDAEECFADSEPTVSMLIRVSDYLEQKRSQLDRELNHFKNQPAWGFSKNREDRRRKGSIAKLRKGYELELAQAKEELALHEATLRDYSHPPSYNRSMMRSPRPEKSTTPVRGSRPGRAKRAAVFA